MYFLVSCSDTIEKLKRIGKAPDLAKLDVPVSEEDLVDPEIKQAQITERKKRTNSLWQPGSTTFFRDTRAWNIGDIVRVIVNVSDSAQLKNTTQQTRNGADSLGVPSLAGKEKGVAKFLSQTGNPASLISTKTSRNQQGAGNITRNEAIQTVIAAVVTQILANGNLVIQGKQEIRVNSELREVKVTGIIRPRDINAQNAVTADQIAEARISYGGRGVISDVQEPRVGSQVLDIVSPF